MEMPRTSITSSWAFDLTVTNWLTTAHTKSFPKLGPFISPKMLRTIFSASPPPMSAFGILSISPRSTCIIVYSNSWRLMLLQSSIDCSSDWGRLGLLLIICLNRLRMLFSEMEEHFKSSHWRSHRPAYLSIGRRPRTFLSKTRLTPISLRRAFQSMVKLAESTTGADPDYLSCHQRKVHSRILATTAQAPKAKPPITARCMIQRTSMLGFLRWLPRPTTLWRQVESKICLTAVPKKSPTLLLHLLTQQLICPFRQRWMILSFTNISFGFCKFVMYIVRNESIRLPSKLYS